MIFQSMYILDLRRCGTPCTLPRLINLSPPPAKQESLKRVAPKPKDKVFLLSGMGFLHLHVSAVRRIHTADAWQGDTWSSLNFVILHKSVVGDEDRAVELIWQSTVPSTNHHGTDDYLAEDIELSTE